jgi:hypothetical protein
VELQPLRIRIDRIVDFGLVVSLVGIDVETSMAVSIHVDNRPVSVMRNALRDAGSPSPVEYVAQRLMLHLDMVPAEVAGSTPVEPNGSRGIESVVDLRSVLELDR